MDSTLIKLVDAEQLDYALTNVADAIRSKSTISGELKFPDDFIGVISSISNKQIDCSLQWFTVPSQEFKASFEFEPKGYMFRACLNTGRYDEYLPNPLDSSKQTRSIDTLIQVSYAMIGGPYNFSTRINHYKGTPNSIIYQTNDNAAFFIKEFNEETGLWDVTVHIEDTTSTEFWFAGTNEELVPDAQGVPYQLVVIG